MLMMMASTVNFEQSIQATNELLSQLNGREIDESTATAEVASLIEHPAGARGFLVAYLTGDSPVADEHPHCVLRGLRESNELITELLIKNLVMSAAARVVHERTKDEKLATGSLKVNRRSQELARLVWNSVLAEHLQNLSEIMDRLIELKKSGRTIADLNIEGSEWAKFLAKGDFDLQQLEAARTAMLAIHTYSSPIQ
jgi:hypothetical protein